jgi:hypothetical protein
MKMFTEDELELLQQGLDTIMSNKAHMKLNDLMLGTLLAPTKEAALANADKVNQEMKEDEEKNKALKNRITLLKAKLIQLSDSLVVTNAMNELKS